MLNQRRPVRVARITAYCILVLSLLQTGCTGTLHSQSANYNSRVSIVVIHHTVANFEDSLRILTEPSASAVSSHYLIPEPDDATYDKARVQTYELVPESLRAWHAGTSYWSGRTGLNDQSIGIELVNQTWCHAATADINPYLGNPDRVCFYPDFADTQIAQLVKLLDGILLRHPDIKPTNIIGHSDIAPDRKIDPGPRFPWQRLARLGYGAWFNDQTVVRFWEQFRTQPLPLVNVQSALAAYGYGIDVTSADDEQTRNVLRAFQMHFRPMQVTGRPDIETVSTLFALIEKYFPERLDELLQITPEIDAADSETELPTPLN